MSKPQPIPIDTVERYLKAMMEIRKSIPGRKKPEGWQFSCMEEFVLKFGRKMKAAARPKGMRKQTDKACFSNAVLLMADRDDLTYCEGFALSLIPVHHAWCVTQDETIVDPTWRGPEKCEYFGIPFKRKFVFEQMIYGRQGCLIDQWEDSWPLLRGKFTPEQFLETLKGRV